MKKVSDILLYIFAVGVIACLFAGALSLLGYVVALIIGGEAATSLCLFVFKTYLPWVIKATSVITGIGLVGMYFSEQKALSFTTQKSKSK